MKHRWCVWTLVLMLATACGAGPTGTPTPDPTALAQASQSAATQSAKNAQATNQRATEKAVQATGTASAEAAATATQNAVASATSRAQSTLEAVAAATALAAPLETEVESLYADGDISRIEGQFYALPDFDESWAQINWYQWWQTGLSPSDFVLTADLAWQSASDRANWSTSGCGFVFRQSGADNHYVAYLGLDGYVYLARNLKGVQRFLGRSYYGVVDVPDGNAQVMLVVDGSNLTFYVNGKRVHYRQDTGLRSGNLAMTLVSGTNKDFGTRCRITNIQLWQLD